MRKRMRIKRCDLKDDSIQRRRKSFFLYYNVYIQFFQIIYDCFEGLSAKQINSRISPLFLFIIICYNS